MIVCGYYWVLELSFTHIRYNFITTNQMTQTLRNIILFLVRTVRRSKVIVGPQKAKTACLKVCKILT